MEQQGIRKTFKYRLAPTVAQARALELILSRCQLLYRKGGRKPPAFKQGMTGPFPLLFSYRSDRLEQYGRARHTQNLQVQTQADA